MLTVRTTIIYALIENFPVYDRRERLEKLPRLSITQSQANAAAAGPGFSWAPGGISRPWRARCRRHRERSPTEKNLQRDLVHQAVNCGARRAKYGNVPSVGNCNVWEACIECYTRIQGDMAIEDDWDRFIIRRSVQQSEHGTLCKKRFPRFTIPVQDATSRVVIH